MIKNLTLLAAFTTLCLTASAQNSFAIFDTLNNNVANGTWAMTDTAQTISPRLKVQNVDVQTLTVTAGRIVISVPPTTANWFSWDETCYAPTVDTSVVDPVMAPQDTAIFIGNYFANSMTGTAAINYCFWDRYNPANSACVSLTYNRLASGISDANQHFQFGVFPNPVSVNENLQLSWNAVPGEMLSVKLISADGKVNAFSFPSSQNLAQISLHNFASGLYVLQIETENGLLYRNKIVVE